MCYNLSDLITSLKQYCTQQLLRHTTAQLLLFFFVACLHKWTGYAAMSTVKLRTRERCLLNSEFFLINPFLSWKEASGILSGLARIKITSHHLFNASAPSGTSSVHEYVICLMHMQYIHNCFCSCGRKFSGHLESSAFNFFFYFPQSVFWDSPLNPAEYNRIWNSVSNKSKQPYFNIKSLSSQSSQLEYSSSGEFWNLRVFKEIIVLPFEETLKW